MSSCGTCLYRGKYAEKDAHLRPWPCTHCDGGSHFQERGTRKKPTPLRVQVEALRAENARLREESRTPLLGAVQQASYELRKFIDSAPSATDARLIKNIGTVLRALYEGALYRLDICKIATILGIQYHMTQHVTTFVDTVREWSNGYDRVLTRAQEAENQNATQAERIAELEESNQNLHDVSLNHIGMAHKAEAELALVREWGRGRGCGLCAHRGHGKVSYVKFCQPCTREPKHIGGTSDNWTPTWAKGDWR